MFFSRVHKTFFAPPFAVLSLLAGCGGNSDGADPPSGPPAPATFAVGGTVFGLAGTVVVQLNNANDLGVTVNGSVRFAGRLETGVAYAVTIKTQPTGQTCSVTNGSGTVAKASITNVAVTCANNLYQVGGTVAGLNGTLGLQLNGNESLAISSSGSFRFANAIENGSAYAVTIAAQPAGQTCTLSNATGTVNATDVTYISINCASVGGGGVAGNVALLAGSTQNGHNDGTGAAASFYQPGCPAVDADGNTFVPEYGNHLIRKVSAAGVVTTYAGSGTSGHSDGVGTAASFNGPAAVALDPAGNLYVAENLTIRKIAPDRAVTTIAGSNYGVADGLGVSAMFETPAGIAVDPVSGKIYVADRNAHNIRRIDENGQVTTVAGTGNIGFTNGAGATATFNGPRCLALNDTGTLFIADTDNNLIRAIDTGTAIVSTFAGSGGYGSLNGPVGVASFGRPYAITFDKSGNLYVADFANNKVRKIAAGEVSTFAGAGVPGSANGSAAAATFWLPNGIAFDAVNQRLVVVDQFTALIRTVEVH